MGEQVGRPEAYFSWGNRLTFDPQVDLELHSRAKQDYPYFKKFREMAAELNVGWDHVDLFFWRETNQARFRELILVGGQSSEVTAFGRSQLEIAFEMIDAASPLCVVVANALASDIYKACRGLEFSEKLGCYLDRRGDRDVPVFLSSMLTGQRALDKHSCRRLAWHTNRVILSVAATLRGGNFERMRVRVTRRAVHPDVHLAASNGARARRSG